MKLLIDTIDGLGLLLLRDSLLVAGLRAASLQEGQELVAARLWIQCSPLIDEVLRLWL